MADYIAIVVGGTGSVGRELIKLLAISTRCKKVVALSRRPIEPSSFATVFPGLPETEASKVLVHVVDFDNLKDEDFAMHHADACFCCLGTTRADAGSAEAFMKVDLHYVSKTAELSKAAGIPYFGLLTASNANKGSWFLYPRTKGLAQEAVANLNFIRTGFFQPGLLRRGDLARSVERWASYVLKSVSVCAVAKAMLANYESTPSTGLTVVSMADILAFDQTSN
ncbi:hypothetical protein H310_02126 [Aphanomyces invadans]|uniref:Semialdehyde dehydrogenase NAD-binding domain-containing protein n=1 Tax=Aphanomyces invadans TaxID=157072 RepID=A0A024UPU4_9STRA|nr:hypothetical protein H310_02126 [Aphanomyces invadans]ETW07663.1 hypothetical protein H310_02126 [Aphanomyces invadans]|eukprot:XP_008863756.1 hypothetical protein H310_02126 [Aphanomyces invadans]